MLAVASGVLCVLVVAFTWTNAWSSSSSVGLPLVPSPSSSSTTSPSLSPSTSPSSSSKEQQCPTPLETRKLIRLDDRDPFSGAYESRPLEDVMIEMGDYADKRDWGRRTYLLQFASKILERDKATPGILRPPVINQTLFELAKHARPYFVYWNSGFDKVQHPILKHLHVITKAQLLNHSIHDAWAKFIPIYLDDDSLPKYIQFPPQIIDKRGKYSTTYFSDLLRLELLASYGGIWADASFYFQKPMPKAIYDSEWFAFKLWHMPYFSSTWFLHTPRPNHPLVLWVRHFMHEYWKTHDSHAYFDLHAFTEITLQLLPEVRAYYDTMPFHSANRAHAYHFIMGGPFNATQHAAAYTQSWGYKLSFKAKCNFVDKLEDEAKERQAFIDAHT